MTLLYHRGTEDTEEFFFFAHRETTMGKNNLLLQKNMYLCVLCGSVVNIFYLFIVKRYCATIGCPLTTGLFARIAAEAAMEEASEGRKRITPYWRTLKQGGELNPKYPGGIESQKAHILSSDFFLISDWIRRI